MLSKFTNLSIWKYIKLLVLITLPVILLILPETHFDSGTSISVFSIFGVEDYAYSTGMTRSIMHLIHFDINGAWSYNKLSFIVLPLLILFWVKLVLNTIELC